MFLGVFLSGYSVSCTHLLLVNNFIQLVPQANSTSSIQVPKLNLPDGGLQITRKETGLYLFDSFRKKFVVLTPEEWVRQNFLMWLVNHLGYPRGLIAVETSLKYNNLHKRADAVVYNKTGDAVVIIECKSADTKLSQDTFSQAAAYNFSFKCQYLILTNGMEHYCCELDFVDNKFRFLEQIPVYNDLK